MDDPFFDIVADGPVPDIRIACGCENGANVRDLNPLSGGGWECDGCKTVFEEWKVNAAIDEYEKNHGPV